MVKAIRVHELGGPEVLKWEDVKIGEPLEGEIRVKNKAIGVNFVDVYYRTGFHKAVLPFLPANATLPLDHVLRDPVLRETLPDNIDSLKEPRATLRLDQHSVGVEGVGEVIAVGPGVTEPEIGDVVAYADIPMGSYAEEQILPASVVVPVPASLDPVIVASALIKGMTARCLVRQCFKVEPGHTVLIHAVAGGTGSLLCQWANALGATVIGTVSNEEKVVHAESDGCHHVINYKQEDFVSRVNEITRGEGVDVVYDSVGKDTFEGSLACLKLRGTMVQFGQSSGLPDPVPISAISAKSLVLTRPGLRNYNTTREELLKAAAELFEKLANGGLRVRVNHKYPLSRAGLAHAQLENRTTSGSIVLIPDDC